MDGNIWYISKLEDNVDLQYDISLNDWWDSKYTDDGVCIDR